MLPYKNGRQWTAAKQSGGASQWEYLYHVAGEPTTIFNGSGVWAFGEIYAGGRHVATYSGATTNFLHTDWLGNIRATSSVSGGNSETCTDLPFGDNRSCSGTDWSWFHFTGDEHDSESNLEHTEFRHQSSTQGRWLSPDPYLGSMDLGNPQSINRYAYVMNGPVNALDPTGLYRTAPDDPADHPMFSQYDGWMFGGGACSMCGRDTRSSEFDNQALSFYGKQYYDLPGTNHLGSNYNAGVNGWYQQMVDDAFNGTNKTDSATDAFDTVIYVYCQETDIFHLSCLPPDRAVTGSLPFMLGDAPAGWIAQQMLQQHRKLWAQSSMTANAAAVGALAVPIVVVAIGEAGGALSACQPGLNTSNYQHVTLYCRAWMAGNVLGVGYDPANGVHFNIGPAHIPLWHW